MYYQLVVIACVIATSTALPLRCEADLVISEFDLAGDQIELVNLGNESVDISSYLWCNRVNGSPFYDDIATVSVINTGLSTTTDFVMNPGDILVMTLPDSFLPDDAGELGLYSDNAFSAPTSIVDYVLWGTDGVRDAVAAAAGIWIDNEAIDLTGLGAGETMQLLFNQPGNNAADYAIAAETLGKAQSIPEPSPVSLLLALGLALAVTAHVPTIQIVVTRFLEQVFCSPCFANRPHDASSREASERLT